VPRRTSHASNTGFYLRHFPAATVLLRDINDERQTDHRFFRADDVNVYVQTVSSHDAYKLENIQSYRHADPRQRIWLRNTGHGHYSNRATVTVFVIV